MKIKKYIYSIDLLYKICFKLYVIMKTKYCVCALISSLLVVVVGSGGGGDDDDGWLRCFLFCLFSI